MKNMVQRPRKMTKKEIVKTISEQIGLTQLKTKDIVQKTFDSIVDTLVTEGRIELRNFGVFEVKKRAARKARNPKTGEKVFVQEKYVVTFKPGKEMEARVRQLEEQEHAQRIALAAAEESRVQVKSQEAATSQPVTPPSIAPSTIDSGSQTSPSERHSDSPSDFK